MIRGRLGVFEEEPLFFVDYTWFGLKRMGFLKACFYAKALRSPYAFYRYMEAKCEDPEAAEGLRRMYVGNFPLKFQGVLYEPTRRERLLAKWMDVWLLVENSFVVVNDVTRGAFQHVVESQGFLVPTQSLSEKMSAYLDINCMISFEKFMAKSRRVRKRRISP